MTKQYRFAHTDSVYTHQPDDPRAVVLQTDGLQPDERGIYDVTERLQALLDSVKQQDRRGIVLIPEGVYSVSQTIYLPRAVRMIGFGKKRPKFVLKKDTSGFQEAPQDDKGEAVYMFWFTGNTPRVEGYIQDANAGTFYSAVSNIDFQIEEGNPAAVVMRAHFAQHGFVSHCVSTLARARQVSLTWETKWRIWSFWGESTASTPPNALPAGLLSWWKAPFPASGNPPSCPGNAD